MVWFLPLLSSTQQTTSKNKTSLANVSRIEKAAEAWTLVLIEVRKVQYYIFLLYLLVSHYVMKLIGTLNMLRRYNTVHITFKNDTLAQS